MFDSCQANMRLQSHIFYSSVIFVCTIRTIALHILPWKESTPNAKGCFTSQILRYFWKTSKRGEGGSFLIQKFHCRFLCFWSFSENSESGFLRCMLTSEAVTQRYNGNFGHLKKSCKSSAGEIFSLLSTAGLHLHSTSTTLLYLNRPHPLHYTTVYSSLKLGVAQCSSVHITVPQWSSVFLNVAQCSST